VTSAHERAGLRESSSDAVVVPLRYGRMHMYVGQDSSVRNKPSCRRTATLEPTLRVRVFARRRCRPARGKHEAYGDERSIKEMSPARSDARLDTECLTLVGARSQRSSTTYEPAVTQTPSPQLLTDTHDRHEIACERSGVTCSCMHALRNGALYPCAPSSTNHSTDDRTADRAYVSVPRMPGHGPR